MISIQKLFCAIVIGVLGFSSAVFAQTDLAEEIVYESIKSYVTHIQVNSDNSIDVTEEILYDGGSTAHHGIYRDLYPYSSQKRKMEIQNVTVVDEQGNPYDVEISKVGLNTRIRIGDPEVTFTGQKTYVIHYRATRAIAQLRKVDELYWNAVGDQWTMPIEYLQVSVTLPNYTSSQQTACYVGPHRSTQNCTQSLSQNGDSVFTAPSVLNAHEDMTIAVGFAKGIVTPYATRDVAGNIFARYWPWALAVGLPLLSLFFSLRHWNIYGRDPKGRGVIIPQYDVLDNLTPLEVAGIMNEAVTGKHVSAEIIYLATHGYLSVRQLSDSQATFFKSPDYELTLLKDTVDGLADFDRTLLTNLFSDGKKTVKVSDVKNVFYKNMPKIVKQVFSGLRTKGYYKNLGSILYRQWQLVIVGFSAVLLPFFFLSALSAFKPLSELLPGAFGIFLAIVSYGVVSYFYPAKSEKGVAAKEHMLGLKRYMQIAEQKRLEFHNAPEKNPELFERLLPFAMTLGVVTIWAKEFEDIYQVAPTWYSQTGGMVFRLSSFSQSMNSFSSYTAAAITSSPSSNGSGGGGFSGGGGGGGGGGSW